MGELAVRTEPGALHHYEPKKGLKKIAVAEAAEKHFARAKDEKGLGKALERNLPAVLARGTFLSGNRLPPRVGKD